ncbi:MAG: hypothetical protein ABIA93_02770 [Candidatus Woesearchaeota archaeon]
MGETIAIIIVVIIMLVLGLVFYSRIQGENVQEKQSTYRGLNAVQVARVVGTLPELTCTRGVAQDTTCVDIVKARIFKTAAENDYVAYQRLIGDAQITVYETYPTKRNISIYNRTVNGSYSSIKIPIIIHDPVNRTNSFGYVQVNTYG